MSNTIDLHDSSIARHWLDNDKGVSKLLDNMQEQEFWALDSHDDLRNAIINWAATLTEVNLADIVENKPDDLILILGFMKSKRALYLLGQIEIKVPGVIAELLLGSIDKIDENKSDTRLNKILLERLVALYRMDLLERIFSEERSEKIKTAIRSTSENYGGIYD